MIRWVDEVETIKQRLENKETLASIGESYGVSRQRMYQVMTKYGIHTADRRKRNWLRDLSPAHYWLNRALCGRGITVKDRMHLVRTLHLPTRCPMLGHELQYDGSQKTGWDQPDNCPSIDKIDPSKGYTLGNIQVISLRANKIKFNATTEELRKIADYMEKIANEI